MSAFWSVSTAAALTVALARLPWRVRKACVFGVRPDRERRLGCGVELWWLRVRGRRESDDEAEAAAMVVVDGGSG